MVLDSRCVVLVAVAVLVAVSAPPTLAAATPTATAGYSCYHRMLSVVDVLSLSLLPPLIFLLF